MIFSFKISAIFLPLFMFICQTSHYVDILFSLTYVIIYFYSIIDYWKLSKLFWILCQVGHGNSFLWSQSLELFETRTMFLWFFSQSLKVCVTGFTLSHLYCLTLGGKGLHKLSCLEIWVLRVPLGFFLFYLCMGILPT